MCIPLKHCCFCVKLDVGAKIIAIFNLVISVVIAMVYGTAAMMPYVAESRKIFYAIVATVAMFQLVVGSLLVYGVFGKKARLILPWLIWCWVFCISLFALSVFGTVLMVIRYQGDQEAMSEMSTMASVYFIYALVLYYFASVIHCRRDEIMYEDHTDSAQKLMKRDHNPVRKYRM